MPPQSPIGDGVLLHLKKPYRKAYEQALPDMLAGERRIVFLKGIGAYPGATATVK